jgi:AcrR family transcriptional regulator
MTADESPLEVALARLWGQQQRPRRGPKPALSVEAIVDAAFEIADADGLGAVSMARVAESLGCSPMALYRHVSSKDELLILLADRVPPEPPQIPKDLGWRDAMEVWMRAQIEMAINRPWYLDLPLSAILPGPRRLRWIDQGFAIMAGLDLTFDEKLQIVGTIAEFVLGEARVIVESQRVAAATLRAAGKVPDGVADAEIDAAALAAANPYADFESVLSRLADPERFPHLFAALETWNPPTPPPAPDPDAFGFGTSVLLEGIEAWVARRTASQ